MRDEEMDELHEKYEPKLERIEEKMRKEMQAIEDAEAEVKERKTAEIVGVAETIFSVFVKRRSRSFSATASRNRMKRKAKQKLQDNREDLEELQEDYADMEEKVKEELAEIREKWEAFSDGISRVEIKPRRTDVKVDTVSLSWHPYWVAGNGTRVSARK